MKKERGYGHLNYSRGQGYKKKFVVEIGWALKWYLKSDYGEDDRSEASQTWTTGSEECVLMPLCLQ